MVKRKSPLSSAEETLTYVEDCYHAILYTQSVSSYAQSG
jgi:hypothetical protein